MRGDEATGGHSAPGTCGVRALRRGRNPPGPWGDAPGAAACARDPGASTGALGGGEMPPARGNGGGDSGAEEAALARAVALMGAWL